MALQQENFGMMDQCYFVPRTQIISWINNLLNLNLTKIEQLGSGAVYCQIIDVIHPGKIVLSKVNWKAKSDYQFINNLKVLQNAFDKIGIKRYVEVEKLAKAKYQDNLQFIQWLKRYYDVNCGERGNSYLPEERRGNVIIDFSFAEKNIVPKTYNGGQIMKSQPLQKKAVSKKKEEVHYRVKSPSHKKISQMKKEIIENEEDEKRNSKEWQSKVKNKETEGEIEWGKLQHYREMAKKSEMRIEMIVEILKTEDESEMKLKMIEEILKN